MPFSQTTLLGVYPPIAIGAEWYLSWTTSSPPETWWQIYIGGVLSWQGQTTNATIGAVELERVSIGTVLPGEEYTDFSSSLPPGPKRRVTLNWTGGSFEGADLAGFNVYGGDAPFLPVDFTKTLQAVTAFPGGIVPPSASAYSWESGPLANGVWAFAVTPFDSAGNLGTPSSVTVTIAGPPTDPPEFSDRERLHYTYNPSTFEAVLAWNAST